MIHVVENVPAVYVIRLTAYPKLPQNLHPPIFDYGAKGSADDRSSTTSFQWLKVEDAALQDFLDWAEESKKDFLKECSKVYKCEEENLLLQTEYLNLIPDPRYIVSQTGVSNEESVKS